MHSLPGIASPGQLPRSRRDTGGYNQSGLSALRTPLLLRPPMPSSPRPAKSRPAIHVTLAGADIRFDWQGDRWAHAVRFDGAAAEQTGGGWHSVEGAGGGDDRWPASPVFVELNTHSVAGSVAVIGLGLAGRSHFSASVAADSSSPGAIRFDIAARIHEIPLHLGSTYESAEPSRSILVRVEPIPSPADVLPRTVEWSYRISPHGIEPLAGARLR